MTKESNAERQRRYRERRKQDTKRELENKKKDLDRYHSKKTSVCELSKRSQRAQRKTWREVKKRQRARAVTDKQEIKEQEESTPTASTSFSTCFSNIQTEKSKLKERRRNRTKLARENLRMKREIESLKRSNEKYRKRAFRSQNKVNFTPNKTDLTPRSKTKALIKECFRGKQKDCQKTVARKLFSYATLLHSLKQNYSSCNNLQKSMLRSIVASGIVKKYKCMQELGFKCFGLKGRLIHAKKNLAHAEKIYNMKRIQHFFNRDDVSRATAGKKETVTKSKVKLQKRYLLDTVLNLHKKYVKEGGKCSYQTFASYRPYNVVFPKVEDRNTCLCFQHSNIKHKAIVLYKQGVINSRDPEGLIDDTVCKAASISCMYGTCNMCSTNIVPIRKVIDENVVVEWPEWVRKKEDVTKKISDKEDKMKKVTKVVKEVKSSQLSKLVKAFQEDFKEFKKHIFNIRQQYTAYKTCISHLQKDEAVLHVDFSENYNCKQSEEVQSHHFGGSRNQVTLHTGVFYTMQEKPITFCTLSSSLEHDPAAIWAHLDPVIRMVKDYKIDIIHFFSDGPCTQYRQKKNFYLFSKYIAKFNFKWATWNFFEAGHGKGAADGVGGVLKRIADREVAHGSDISDACQFFNSLKEKTKVKLFLITQKEITEVRETLPNQIPVLKGTMSVHQLATAGDGLFKYREVSCFCEKINRQLCVCYKTGEYSCINYSTTEKNHSKLKVSDVYSSASSEADEMSLDEDLGENEKHISQEIVSKNIKAGIYMLAEFKAQSIQRKLKYRYVVVAQEDIDDGEVRVMCLKTVNDSGILFRPDDEDISYIDFDQIIKILPDPKVKMQGGRLYYEFSYSVDVYEKS